LVCRWAWSRASSVVPTRTPPAEERCGRPQLPYTNKALSDSFSRESEDDKSRFARLPEWTIQRASITVWEMFRVPSRRP
jgi:hypothetical protein